MSMGALVQLSGREAGCLFFCSPFITLMKTVIVCIPPELSSAGEVKKFLRRLSEEIRGFWEPRCPGCGSKRVWRDGAEPRKTAPPAQRYECPRCGKKFCDKTGPEPLREARPLRQVPRDGGWDGARGWNSGGSPWTQEVDRRRDLRQGRGENNVPGFRVVDWRGRTLSRVLSPRRRETEAEMVLSEASKRYGKPEVFMHDGNRVYHRALRNLDLDWREGVVVHRREWVAPGTAPPPTPWRGSGASSGAGAGCTGDSRGGRTPSTTTSSTAGRGTTRKKH